MANEKQVRGLLRAISGAYPTFELTDDRVSIYVKLLADLDADALTAAAQQHIVTSKFPPTVAELRDGCANLTRPALPAWADAWGEVLEAIRRVGYLGQPSFSHPLIEQAVQGMGGWKLLCAMEISETATQRAQFRDIYNAYASRCEREAALLPAVRALAVQRGALPVPAEPAPLALPEPSAVGQEPSRPAVAPMQPVKFAEYVQKWRTQSRLDREAEGRRKAEEGSRAAV
jgi:hypothetical protein